MQDKLTTRRSNVLITYSICSRLIPSFDSEMTPQGRKATKLKQTLLNGNNIALVSKSHTKGCKSYISFESELLSLTSSLLFPSPLQLIPGGEGPEA